jgi:hypothetical protein
MPKQKATETWSVELILDTQEIDTQTVAITQVGNLVINPKYKNSNTISDPSLTFEVSAVGHKINQKPFTLESFKSTHVSSMLAEVGISKGKEHSCI